MKLLGLVLLSVTLGAAIAKDEKQRHGGIKDKLADDQQHNLARSNVTLQQRSCVDRVRATTLTTWRFSSTYPVMISKATDVGVYALVRWSPVPFSLSLTMLPWRVRRPNQILSVSIP